MADNPARRRQPVRLVRASVRTDRESEDAVAAAQGEALRELLPALSARQNPDPDRSGESKAGRSEGGGTG